VTAAPGATIRSGSVDWADPELASGKSIVYPVTFKVDAYITGPDTIGAITEDNGYDANATNNVAITTIQLIPAST
jgi:hypothetical protein